MKMMNSAKKIRRNLTWHLFAIFCVILPANTYCFAQAGHEANYLGRLYPNTPTLNSDWNDLYNGINNPNAYIRQESARSICEFGDATKSALLWQKAQAEDDPPTQKEITYYAVKLDFKYAADKADYVINFLNGLTWDNINIRSKALEYLISEAENAGIQQAVEPLNTLKSNLFRDNTNMQSVLDDAIDIISLQRGKDLSNPDNLRAFYLAALASQRGSLEEQVIQKITQDNTPLTQRLANDFLINWFLSTKKGRGAGLLKDEMEKKGILIAENINPSFEDTQDKHAPGNCDPGFQPISITCTPLGWFGEATRGTPNTIQYADPGVVAAPSYAKCLEVNNGSQETRIVNDRITFRENLPRTIEFGVSYTMEYALDGSFRGNNGNPAEAAREDITLLARLIRITFDDGSVCDDAPQIEDASPYKFDWAQLRGSYTAPLGKRIQSLQLAVIVRGNGRIYLDDAYVRRSESEFPHATPVVTAVNASPAVIIPGDTVTLNATLDSDSASDMVIGQWVSDREGPLGAPMQGKDMLATQVSLNQAGTHTISFKARDEWGTESLVASTTVDVVTPTAVLSTLPVRFSGSQVAGKVNFMAYITNLPEQYSYSGILYSSGRKQQLGSLRNGLPLVVDTRSIANGVTKFYALLNISRKSPSTEVATIGTNTIILFVANSPGTRKTKP